MIERPDRHNNVAETLRTNPAKVLPEVLFLKVMADRSSLPRFIATIAAAAAALPGVGVAAAQPSFPSDDKGFINSPARCDASQTALAIGRTQRSLVVICADQNGHYQYRGVRVSDGAVLQAPAETTSSGGFLAHQEGVTYAVSSTQLMVTEGDTVVSQEKMIDYRQPHAYAAEVGAAPRR